MEMKLLARGSGLFFYGDYTDDNNQNICCGMILVI
jgi:hypothetical protein